MTSPTTPEEPRKVKGSHKFLAGIALTVGLAVALTLLLSQRGLYQIYRFRSERLTLEQENARLAAENARLAHTIDRLQHDPEMIQDLIRRELNCVKKNEIIFQLPPDGSDKPTSSPAISAVSPPAAVAPYTGAQTNVGKRRFAWEALEGAPKKGNPGPPLR